MTTEAMSRRPTYEIRVWEQWRQITHHAIEDPFIRTEIRPRGWRNALAVLLGRYSVRVHVSGDRETEEAVMELDPEYLGGPGSASRRAWNQSLERALSAFAEEE
jgi:hypothetical protein